MKPGRRWGGKGEKEQQMASGEGAGERACRDVG